MLLSQIEICDFRLEAKKHLGNAEKLGTFYLSVPDNLDTGNDVKVLPVAHIFYLDLFFGNVAINSVANKLGDKEKQKEKTQW